MAKLDARTMAAVRLLSRRFIGNTACPRRAEFEVWVEASRKWFHSDGSGFASVAVEFRVTVPPLKKARPK